MFDFDFLHDLDNLNPMDTNFDHHINAQELETHEIINGHLHGFQDLNNDNFQDQFQHDLNNDNFIDDFQANFNHNSVIDRFENSIYNTKMDNDINFDGHTDYLDTILMEGIKLK